jgi:hypothetical protein
VAAHRSESDHLRHEADRVREDMKKKPTTPSVESSSETRVAHNERLEQLDELRYRLSLQEERRRGFEALSETERKEESSDWAEKHPLVPETKEMKGEIARHVNKQYENYLLMLDDADAETFFALTNEEQQAQVEEYLQNELEKKRAEAKKSRKEVREERRQESAKRTIPEDNPHLNAEVDHHKISRYLESLTAREYEEFLKLEPLKQAAMINVWTKRRLDDFTDIRRDFTDSLDEESLRKFEGMSDAEKLEFLYHYRDGGPLGEFKFKGGSGGEFYGYDEEGKELRPPSYHTYDEYKDEDGEKFWQVITEHKRQYNQLSAEEKAQLRWSDRLLGFIWGKTYNIMSTLFDFEKRIAEENKANQEMIRNIVDTGPDYNERIVFAQLQADGVTYLDYNGNKVPAHVVRAQQKKALHNPSRFQALCHYELSKREEPEQMRLWEEIFSMMAHHGYNKYAMWGVVVGLQFMNKPSYLAFKNAQIEWAPEYETYTDDHGHRQFLRDDDGRPKVLRYTAETAFDHRGKPVLDSDGMPVKIGDIVRSRTRARFATTELVVHPGDQEYDETRPDTGEERYATRIRKIRSDHELDENGELKVIREEIYKVKTILKIKELAFAHELAEKFASYQYGFRSADVAITVDVARHAMQTALIHARRGNFRAKEFQEAVYTLSRLKKTVDATRLGGAGGESGDMSEQMFMQQMELNAKLAGNSDKEIKRIERARGGMYPPRISGTAISNAMWDELARIVDNAAEVFPNIKQILWSDYAAVQEPELPHGDDATIPSPRPVGRPHRQGLLNGGRRRRSKKKEDANV